MPLRPSLPPYYPPGEYERLLNHNYYVPVYLYVVLSAFAVCAVAANLTGRFLSWQRRGTAAKWIGRKRPSAACSRTGKGCTRWVPSTILATTRKIGYRRSRVAEFVGMSSWGEVIVIGSWYLVNIILTVTGADQNIDFMAHHAARLAYANLPLVIGLASKNNTIAWMTGFSYESLNIFHRWIARLFLLLSFVHVVGRIYVNYPVINPAARGQSAPYGGAYLRWGILAFVCFTLMITGAARTLRNRFYSFFIISHVGLFLLGITALAVHRPTVAPWLYAGIIIYFLDRIIRTARIVWHHNINVVNPALFKDDHIGKVEALSPTTIRVTLLTTLDWIPGQHLYLHVPFLSAGGHPFSICSIDKPLTQTTDTRCTVSTAVLLIRVRNGLTKRLYQLAMGDVESALAGSSPSTLGSEFSRKKSQSGQPFPMARISPVWGEGPYGTRSNLDYYQTVLLVAGGSGVSFALPVMLDMVRRARSMSLGHREVAVATERLTFVWIIRDAENVEWIGDQLREAIALSPPNFLSVRVYVTSPTFVALPHALIPASRCDVPIPIQVPPPAMIPTPKKRLSVAGRLVESTLPLAHAVMSEHTSSYPPKQSLSSLTQTASTASLLSSDTFHTPSPSLYNSAHPSSIYTRSPASVIIPLFGGRPNLRAILEEEISATDYSDYFAVGACGPGPMTQDLANAVSDAIHTDKVLRGEKRRNIRLHCEEFGW